MPCKSPSHFMLLGRRTCMLTERQPCTIRDFMNYLIYVERSAENLQFFLWHRDYSRRFADAKTPDIALAHEWTQSMEDDALVRVKEEQAEQARQAPKESAGIFKGTDFEKGSAATADKSQYGLPLRPSVISKWL